MKINEVLTDIVFHHTSLANAYSILKDKRFALTASFGTKSEKDYQHKDHYYYLSTARGKTADFTLHNTYEWAAVFNLNGQWFNHKYKSKPIDYWDRQWLKTREAGSKDRFSEMEDRIYSREPYIEFSDPTDPISEIHILVKLEEFSENKNAKNLIYLCMKNKIPFFVYSDKNDFILQNKSKSLTKSEILQYIKTLGQPRSVSRKGTDWLARWKELYYKKSYDELSSDGKRARDMIRSEYYMQDAIRSIEADIHNMRTSNRDAVKSFLDIMRKEKFHDVKEFLDNMREKWFPMD